MVEYRTGGGESPDINAYLRAKVKVSVFENEQFSGHLIFDKKTFFSEKKCFFPPINKNFVFLKKKHVPFFEKKCFFLEMFVRKCFFKISKTFLPKNKKTIFLSRPPNGKKQDPQNRRIIFIFRNLISKNTVGKMFQKKIPPPHRN